MEIKLHFLPEKPTESCKAIVFKTLPNGDLFSVTLTDYSKEWGLFHMTDDREDMPKCTWLTNGDIIAWAYLSEVEEEFKDEIH